MQLLWQDVEVAKDNEWCAIFRKAAEKGIHLVVEVTKGTWRTVDHHNEELLRAKIWQLWHCLRIWRRVRDATVFFLGVCVSIFLCNDRSTKACYILGIFID